MTYQLPTHINPNKIFLINHSEIEGRIDPIFYGSDISMFIRNRDSVKLSTVCLSFKSGFGAGKEEQATEEDGIIQIRPTNIDNDGFLKFDKNIYVPLNNKIDFLKGETVLFNNTNSQELVGKTAILREDKKLYCSNHITAISVDKEKIIPEYLWMILNLYQRHKIFYSICTNWNNQSGIGIDLLKTIKIPIFSLEKQDSITEKYLAAYQTKQQKEAEAQKLLDSIDDYLLGELGITLPEASETKPEDIPAWMDAENPLVKNGRLFLTRFSEVEGRRFDPYYHQNYFIKAFKALKNSKYPISILKNISLKITSGITPLSGGDAYTYEADGIPFVRSGNIDINGDLDFEDLLYLKPEIHKTTMKSSQLKYGDLMIAIVGATIGQVGVYLNDREANINQAIALVRLNKNIDFQYMKELIKSSIGQLNLNRLKRPVARANINLEEISTMLVILPPLSKQNEITTHILAVREQAKTLKVEAAKVLELAKLQVEQMILGE